MNATSELTRLHRWETKVSKTNTCWLWTGSRSAAGYGTFMWDAGPPCLRITAHRASYRLFIGPIPDGHEVDHLCRVRHCVNPAHLEAVTLQENRRRRHHATGTATVNGRKTHCIHGHPFSEANLRILKSGERVCRTCAREAMRRHRARS